MGVIAVATLPDQIAEVRREIDMRRRTYIRMIDNGRMTPEEAETRTANMVAVLHTLEMVRNRETGGVVTVSI
jgi:hypothetical protein